MPIATGQNTHPVIAIDNGGLSCRSYIASFHIAWDYHKDNHCSGFLLPRFHGLCLFLVLFMDIYRLLSSFSFLPLLGTTLQAQIWKVGICLIIVLISFGSLNARKARIVTLSPEMPLGNPAIDSLCAVAVSDIHVGPFINSSRIRGLVDKINGLSPDIVFLVGDIVDESISAAAEEGLTEELKKG